MDLTFFQNENFRKDFNRKDVQADVKITVEYYLFLSRNKIL